VAADTPCHPTNLQRAETTRRGKNSTHGAPEGLREGQRNTRREVGGAYKVCPPFFFIFYYSTHHINRTLPPPPNRHVWHPFGLRFNVTRVILTSSNPPLHRNARWGVSSPTIHPSACVSASSSSQNARGPSLTPNTRRRGRSALPSSPRSPLSLEMQDGGLLYSPSHVLMGGMFSDPSPVPPSLETWDGQVPYPPPPRVSMRGRCLDHPWPCVKTRAAGSRIALRLVFRREGGVWTTPLWTCTDTCFIRTWVPLYAVFLLLYCINSNN